MAKSGQHPLELGILQFDEQVKRVLQTVSNQLKDFQGIPEPNQQKRRQGPPTQGAGVRPSTFVDGGPQPFNPFGVF